MEYKKITIPEFPKYKIDTNGIVYNQNGTVKKLNLKDWDDDVREAFQAAGFKEARQNVQESNIATQNKWMRSTEMGKTLFQFLSFTMSSLDQQTSRLAVRARDKDVAVAKIMLSAFMMGSLMYAARTHLNAAGRSDRDEYIQQQMQPHKLVLGSLQQIGAASLFSYVLQVASGSMQGNAFAITPPVVGIGYSLAASGKNLFDYAVEGDISEAEARKLLRLAPFQSLYGARQALNAAANAWAN